VRIMKKKLSFLMLILLSVFFVVSCGKNSDDTTSTTDEDSTTTVSELTSSNGCVISGYSFDSNTVFNVVIDSSSDTTSSYSSKVEEDEIIKATISYSLTLDDEVLALDSTFTITMPQALFTDYGMTSSNAKYYYFYLDNDNTLTKQNITVEDTTLVFSTSVLDTYVISYDTYVWSDIVWQ